MNITHSVPVLEFFQLSQLTNKVMKGSLIISLKLLITGGEQSKQSIDIRPGVIFDGI